MSFFHRRIIHPLIALLKQGLTPEKLALSVAFGIMLGVFPMLGSTTLLCIFVAFLLRLNQPAIHLINYAMLPAHLAMLLPFIRAGEILFGVKPVPFSLTEVFAMLHADLWGTIQKFWVSTVHAIVAWGLTAPVVIAVVYLVLTPVFRRLARRYRDGLSS